MIYKPIMSSYLCDFVYYSTPGWPSSSYTDFAVSLNVPTVFTPHAFCTSTYKTPSPRLSPSPPSNFCSGVTDQTSDSGAVWPQCQIMTVTPGILSTREPLTPLLSSLATMVVLISIMWYNLWDLPFIICFLSLVPWEKRPLSHLFTDIFKD